MKCSRRHLGRTRTGQQLGPCTRAAVWRVSDLSDPWPLQYACDDHLVEQVRELGGDVHVQRLEPGQSTPQPRFRIGGLPVTADPKIPRDEVHIVGKTTAVIKIVEDDEPLPPLYCPSTYITASTPHRTVTCERLDNAQAHEDRLHRRDAGDVVPRWPVTAADRDRWSLSDRSATE